MVRILLSLLCAYQSCGSRTVMTIGDIETRHLGKFSGDGFDILVIADNPELMTEAINWSDEIILWLCCCITHQNLIEHRIIRISKENRFDVCIADTNVLHTILFLITTGKLMLLDDAGHIIIYVCTHNKTILCLAIHGLCIDIILFLIILLQPAVLLELLEVLCSTFIDARIIFRCTWFEVDFRFNDMIKAFLVIASLSTSFL